jgi:hypothetical protein
MIHVMTTLTHRTSYGWLGNSLSLPPLPPLFVCVCVCARAHVFMCVRVWVCTCISLSLYIYIYIYINEVEITFVTEIGWITQYCPILLWKKKETHT